MGNFQTGYGHGDVVGVPFDFYSSAAALPTGVAIQMQSGVLLLVPAAAITGVAITLPLNPGDGAIAEITNAGAVGSTVTGTVSANTGDTILNGGLGAPTVITPAAATTAGSAAPTLRYRYTLNGYLPNPNGVAINPRTWVRVQ